MSLLWWCCSLRHQLFCDGASRSNPGDASIGVSVLLDGEEIHTISKKIGIATNNEAEYLALIAGINLCIENQISNISIFADSELVVKQINGDYKVKNDRMSALHKKTHELLSKLNSWEIKHVLRELNVEADELSKQGLAK